MTYTYTEFFQLLLKKQRKNKTKENYQDTAQKYSKGNAAF